MTMFQNPHVTGGLSGRYKTFLCNEEDQGIMYYLFILTYNCYQLKTYDSFNGLVTSWLYVVRNNYGSSHLFLILCRFEGPKVNLNEPDSTLSHKGIRQYINTTLYLCVMCVSVHDESSIWTTKH